MVDEGKWRGEERSRPPGVVASGGLLRYEDGLKVAGRG